ncbi:MAG: ABC transporter ATP-binding protein [Parvularculaceae bacterium]
MTIAAATPDPAVKATADDRARARLQDVRKSFGSSADEVRVLNGVTFEIAAGESVALTGESGSGKSTILHLIAGLDAFDSGEIRVGDAALSALDDAGRAALRRERVGVVFQQFNLVPSLRVVDNLAFQARLAGRHDDAWTQRLAGDLGLGGLLDRYPEQLSGGQQQRVAIGRALAARPPLLLADEPTGNLDEATSDDVIALTLRLAAETGASLLMVTHSERLAARLDRRLHLSGGVVS